MTTTSNPITSNPITSSAITSYTAEPRTMLESGGTSAEVGSLARLRAACLALSPRRHTALAIMAVIALAIANAVLTASYNASAFPVPFFEGQTTFDGDLLRSYYATMIDAGTLDIYWRTQFIDFAFIAAMAFVGLAAGTRLQRAAGRGWLARIAGIAGVGLIIGAGLDAIENLISFALLAQAETFPNWLAMIYSGTAAAKFAVEVPSIIALVFAAIALAVRRLWSLAR